MNEITTNIFEDTFISVMNILHKMEHVLFEAIVTNKDGKARYPMRRSWVDLGHLTLAWHIHQPLHDDLCIDRDEEIIEEDVVESNDNVSDELNVLNLEDDRYETALGSLMLLLNANNFPLFEQIADVSTSNVEKSVYEDGYDDHQEDPEMIKLGYAWKVWCDQNVNKCTVDEFEVLQRKIVEDREIDV